MFDEYGNPIQIGTAVVAAQGGGAGFYPPLPPTMLPGSAGNAGGLMPTMQIPQRVSAGNQNEFFQMPDLGQQAYGLGGATDYTGGFNTTGGGNFAPGLAGMQGFSAAPEADIPLPFETPIGITGMSVIQPKPTNQQNTLSPMSSLGIPTLDAGPYATPGSVADTSMQGMKTLGVEQLAGGSGPNTGGLVDSAMTGPAVMAYSNNKAAEGAAAAASTATDSAGKLNMQSAGMIASGVLGVAGGVTDIIQGGKNMRSAQAEQAKRQSEIDRLKASQPSLSTPAEYYERVKNAYDSRLMQMRTEDINRGLANTTAAAASFGSRGLGALAGATQSANRAQREEVLQQQQLQTTALGDLAAAQERTLGMQEARNVRETEYAQSALETAQQNELLAQQQRMAGIASTVGGVAQIGLGAINPVPLPMAEGGKVQKTPGKFSHEENEMAVITEDGEDTGVRVTGGEYVLNPEQAESIKKLVESGDKDALMRYMDDLLDEPQFA